MRRRKRSLRARQIASTLAVSLVIALGLVRWMGGPSAAVTPIRGSDPVDPSPPARPTEFAHQADRRASSSASPAAGPSPGGTPSRTGGAATPPPVFDFATLPHQSAPEPSLDDDRFRTDDEFTAEDLAHPERYFEAAEQLPELRRDEERYDVLEF